MLETAVMSIVLLCKPQYSGQSIYPHPVICSFIRTVIVRVWTQAGGHWQARMQALFDIIVLHIVERVVQMAIFLLLSAAPKHILLYKIHCASVQHSLSPPESFIVCLLLGKLLGKLRGKLHG